LQLTIATNDEFRAFSVGANVIGILRQAIRLATITIFLVSVVANLTNLDVTISANCFGAAIFHRRSIGNVDHRSPPI
jgi:hypothetical protein